MSLSVLTLLEQRRSELTGIGSNFANWSKITELHAGVKPLISKHFKDSVKDFNKIVELKFAQSPFVIGPGTSDAAFARMAQADNQANDKIVKDAKDKLLAFLNGLIDVERLKHQTVTPLVKVDGAGWDNAQYDVVQICPNGHTVNVYFKSKPIHNSPRCQKCGEQTITSCLKCNSEIRGSLTREDGYHQPTSFIPPSFCIQCGEAFPWTVRKKQAAIDLFIDEIQEEEERKHFRENIEEISKDSLQAPVSSNRILRQLKKIQQPVKEKIVKLLGELATGSAKDIFLEWIKHQT